MAPFALASILGLALGSGEGGFSTTIAVANDDQGDLGAGFATGLTQASEANDGGIVFAQADSGEEARQAVVDGRAAAAIVIPDGFEASLAEPIALDLVVITRVDRPISGDVAEGVADDLASRVESQRLAVNVVVAPGTGPSTGEAIAAVGAAARLLQLSVSVEDSREDQPGVKLISFFGPSMGLLFLYFTVGFAARSLLAEKRDGTLARLQAAPISARSVLGGKALAALVLGMTSLMALWAATTVVFGATWGQPLAVFVLCLATVLAVTGITALILSLVKTEAAADGLASVVAFTFALIGGNFFTPDVLREGLRFASRFTPNGWSLQAFTELTFDGGGHSDIVDALLVLTLFGVVTGGLALFRFRSLVAA